MRKFEVILKKEVIKKIEVSTDSKNESVIVLNDIIDYVENNKNYLIHCIDEDNNLISKENYLIPIKAKIEKVYDVVDIKNTFEI